MCKFLWPFILVISGIRAVAMIVELQRGQVFTPIQNESSLSELNWLFFFSSPHRKDNIAWECDNGGQLWPASVTAGYDNDTSFPGAFCTSGFTSVYTAFIISLLADIGIQVRLCVCDVFTCSRPYDVRTYGMVADAGFEP